MSNKTKHQYERSIRLAHFAGLEEYEGENPYSSPCWLNPYDGVLYNNIYSSMSFTWYIHERAVRQYPAYRAWWIAHALDSQETPHWDWLDMVYTVINGQKRPILIVDGEVRPHQSVVTVMSELAKEPQVSRSLRRSGREVICVTTEKGIVA